MRTHPLKSPCCQSKSIGYGKKRRQCSHCKKVWTLRPRKRGPKRKRDSPKLLEQLFQDGYTLPQALHLRPHRSYASLRYQMRRSLSKYVDKPRRDLFSNHPPLILLLDGKWFRFQKQTWVLYLMALRPVEATQAVLMDPVLLPGREYACQWRQALTTLPDSLQVQVCALVSDGFRGAKGLAEEHGWVYQRCQFHLLREFLRRLGMKQKPSSRKVREHIRQTLQEALVPQNQHTLSSALQSLQRWSISPRLSSRAKRVLREFFRDLTSFHTYRDYPHYRLPTTNNTLESYTSLLSKRLRGIRSPNALLRWATAFIRMNPTITCNGKNYQQN